MDRHLVLILVEMLDRVTLTGVAIKSWNHELLEKFIFQYVLRKVGIGCISDDGSESVVVRHSYFFDSLLYKLVEILDTDELLYPSPRVIMLSLVRGRDELDPPSDRFEGVWEAVLRHLWLWYGSIS